MLLLFSEIWICLLCCMAQCETAMVWMYTGAIQLKFPKGQIFGGSSSQQATKLLCPRFGALVKYLLKYLYFSEHWQMQGKRSDFITNLSPNSEISNCILHPDFCLLLFCITRCCCNYVNFMNVEAIKAFFWKWPPKNSISFMLHKKCHFV